MRFREQLDIGNTGIDILQNMTKLKDYLSQITSNRIESQNSPKENLQMFLKENVKYTEENEYLFQEVNMIRLDITNSDEYSHFADLSNLPYAANLYYSIDNALKTKIDYDSLSKLTIDINTLLDILNGVKQSIQLSLPNPLGNGISIRTPDFLTLNESKKFFSSLDKAFELILGNEKLESKEIKFSNFDTGTNWIDIALFSSIGVVLLNTVIKSSLFYIQEYQQIKMTKRHIESVEVEHDFKKHFIAQLEKKLQKDTTDYLNNNLVGEELDNSEEYLNRAYKGIKIFSKLMEEGTTFENTIKNIENVKQSLPPVSEQQKQINKFILSDQQKYKLGNNDSET